jgi:hypothetical protein
MVGFVVTLGATATVLMVEYAAMAVAANARDTVDEARKTNQIVAVTQRLDLVRSIHMFSNLPIAQLSEPLCEPGRRTSD